VPLRKRRGGAKRSGVTVFSQPTRSSKSRPTVPALTTNSYSGVSASGGPLLTTRAYESADPMTEASPPRRGPPPQSTCRNCRRFAPGRGLCGLRHGSAISNGPQCPVRRSPGARPGLPPFYDRMVVFDNVAKTIVVVAMARLDRPGATVESAMTTPGGVSMPWSSNWPRDPLTLGNWVDIRPEGEVNLGIPLELHAAAVRERRLRRCVEYIRAGDIFQVVIQPAVGGAGSHGPSVRDLPARCGCQPQSVHVLRPHAERDPWSAARPG